MKWYHALAVVVALALFITGTAFCDARLHFSKRPPGTITMVEGRTEAERFSYRDAKAGKYVGKQIIIGVFITQIQPQADGSFLIWNNLRWQSPDPGGLVVVRTTAQFLKEGGQGWFLCRWIKNVTVTVTDSVTGEQETGDIPYFEAEETGVTVTQ